MITEPTTKDAELALAIARDHSECMTPKIGNKWVNPTIAAEYEALPVWPGQRVVRDQKVAEYAEKMRNGLWGVPDSSIIVANVKGTRHVFNGRHRFRAVKESGYSGLMPWQEYRFCCAAEAEEVYGRIDRLLPRTVGETLPPSIAEELGVSRGVITRVVSGLEMIIRGFQVKPWTISEDVPLTNDHLVRTRAVRDWQDQVGIYHNLISGGKSVMKMLRSDIISVALVTLRWQRGRAEPFWRMVAHDDGLAAETGGNALRDLVDGINKTYSKEPAYVKAKAVATCWNAHLAGRALKFLRVYEESRNKPIRIDGTPYNGEIFLVQHYEREGWTADARGIL